MLTQPILANQCAFCGKEGQDGAELVSGFEARICKDCIANYSRSLTKTQGEKPHCSFCLSDSRELIAGKNGHICGICLKFCGEIQ